MPAGAVEKANSYPDWSVESSERFGADPLRPTHAVQIWADFSYAEPAANMGGGR
jgi:hypothetical protein